MQFDASAIRKLFEELETHLTLDESPSVIVITGGALLALRGLRSATTDVDAVSNLSSIIRIAATSVARSRDLDPSWLNNRAQAFVPATFDVATCEPEIVRGRLVVLGVSMTDLFLMKLNAARDRDLEDLELLWPHSGFESPQRAVDAYYAAYPDESFDPFLEAFVGMIANRAEHR